MYFHDTNVYKLGYTAFDLLINLLAKLDEDFKKRACPCLKCTSPDLKCICF